MNSPLQARLNQEVIYNQILNTRMFVYSVQERRLHAVMGWLFLLGLVVSLFGCGQESAKQAASMPPLPVKVAQPVSRELIEWDEYPGRIEAVESVDVRARVDGYLKSVNFKAGDVVNKGDLLFQIDPRPFKALQNHAQAELEQAKARLELAKNNLTRAEHMYKAKAISEEEYDARSKGLTEAAAAVQSAEASVYTARLNLEFTEVRSPITGRVGRELITAGNLVKGSGADATLLTFIVSTDPVYVYVDVDERSALKYQKYRRSAGLGCVSNQADDHEGCVPVEMALADESGFPHKGYIEYESPRLNVSTGTLSLRSIFPNKDDRLSPGLFVRLRVPGSLPLKSILLPDRAVATDLAQRFVWVVNAENKVERRSITRGPLSEGLRVIGEGLKPDEWVVIEGIQKLKPGASVLPEKINLTEAGQH